MKQSTAVKLVDKAEKEKKVSKVVNRKYQRSQKSDWSFAPSLYVDFLKLLGNILILPVVLIMASMEGIKAGVVAALEKALKMYR